MSIDIAPRSHIAWIDTCKGIGIIAIVIGHTQHGTFLSRFIYIFHMPLFFFLSGYLHTVTPGLKRYCKKKAIHLLLPYTAFLLVLFPYACLHIMHHGGSYIHLASDFLWGGTHLIGQYAVFWFVTCLFFTQQIMNMLLVKSKASMIALIMVLFMTLSYVSSSYIPNLDSPLSLHLVLASSPLFFLGYVSRKISFHARWVRFFSLAGVALSLILQSHGMAISYDMKYAVYGVPVLSVLLSLSCIVSVMLLSQALCSIPIAEKILGKIGAASMGIMFLHNVFYIPHAAQRMIVPGSWIACCLILLASYMITYLLSLSRLTRALFLGSENDYRKLTWYPRSVELPDLERPTPA